MCHAHHKITDDEGQYSVDKLLEIKRSHEGKFINIIATIQKSVHDLTTLSSPDYPKNMRKLDDVLKWDLNESQIKESLKELNGFINKLMKLPHVTRELATIMAQRNKGNVIGSFDLKVPLLEIESVTGMDSQFILGQIEILENYNIVSGIQEDDYGRPYVELHSLESGWMIWSDLVKFAKRTNISLNEIIVNMNFKLLDAV